MSDSAVIVEAARTPIGTFNGALSGIPATRLGAHVIKASNIAEFKTALKTAKTIDRTTMIYIEVDRKKAVPGFAWWDVAVAEVSEKEEVNKSFKKLQDNRKNQKHYL